MKLRKIDDKTYVNVGVGNVTSVAGGRNLSGGHWTVVNFVSGKQLEVMGKIDEVVRALEAEPTKSWGRS